MKEKEEKTLKTQLCENMIWRYNERDSLTPYNEMTQEGLYAVKTNQSLMLFFPYFRYFIYFPSFSVVFTPPTTFPFLPLSYPVFIIFHTAIIITSNYFLVSQTIFFSSNSVKDDNIFLFNSNKIANIDTIHWWQKSPLITYFIISSPLNSLD